MASKPKPIQRRREKRPPALWKQIEDAAQPTDPTNAPRGRPGRKTPRPRQKRPNPVSDRMRKARQEYERKKKAWFKETWFCCACKPIGIATTGLARRTPALATDLHHQRGRQGSLLSDERFWLPVCSECHSWIHDHPGEAREIQSDHHTNLKLIAGPGEWNTPQDNE